MRAVDPLQYEADTLQYFDTLLKTDPDRAAYFCDLRSKFVMENAIVRSLKSDSRELDLSGKVGSWLSLVKREGVRGFLRGCRRERLWVLPEPKEKVWRMLL